MTLEAAKWNCAGGELSSCVMNNIPLHYYHNIRNTFGTNLPVDFLSFCFVLCTSRIILTYIYIYISIYIYIYMFKFLMYCDLNA